MLLDNNTVYRGFQRRRRIEDKISRSMIESKLIQLGLDKITFKNTNQFKRSRNIRAKISKLKKELRRKGLSKEEIEKHVEELKDKEEEKLRRRVVGLIADIVYKLIRGGTTSKRLTRIPYYKKWYLEKYLDFLIHQGMIKAIYRGPRPKEFEDERCRRVRSIPGDPWDKDPYRSGELKIWLFYTTGNKTLREKRLKCWAPYIVIDFSPLIDRVSGDK